MIDSEVSVFLSPAAMGGSTCGRRGCMKLNKMRVFWEEQDCEAFEGDLK